LFRREHALRRDDVLRHEAGARREATVVERIDEVEDTIPDVLSLLPSPTQEAAEAADGVGRYVDYGLLGRREGRAGDRAHARRRVPDDPRHGVADGIGDRRNDAFDGPAQERILVGGARPVLAPAGRGLEETVRPDRQTVERRERV